MPRESVIANNMNALKFLLMLSFLVLVSCRPSEQGSTTVIEEANRIEQKAMNYLEKVVPLGQTRNELLTKFGAPVHETATTNGEVCLTFLFPDICGFTQRFGVARRGHECDGHSANGR